MTATDGSPPRDGSDDVAEVRLPPIEGALQPATGEAPRPPTGEGSQPPTGQAPLPEAVTSAGRAAARGISDGSAPGEPWANERGERTGDDRQSGGLDAGVHVAEGRVDNRDEDQDERTTDARLARIHLRTGSYGLARAELESIAGAGTLDGEALADLAEVRWRTGDLPGAGEAAQAYLATGREAAAPLAIAAEAAAALGRPGEARRLATRALAATGGSIDEVFLGIARSPIWPGDERRAEPAAELFPGAMSPSGDTDRRPPGAPAGGAVGAATAGGAGRARRTVGGGAVRTGAPGLPPWAVTFAAASEVAGGSSPADAGAGVGGPTEPRVSDAAFASGAAAGLWDGHPIPDAAEPLPDPAAELAAARAAIAADDHDGAALHLALALRLDPSTAPAVLDAAGHHRSAALEMVKGDALRLVGHDVEARRAYAAAARSMAKHTEQRRQ